VGAAVNGTSGASPPGCGNPCDASIGLLIPVTLSGGAADGVPTTIDVVITTTYGATTPGGALEGGACPADCGNGDHAVGIVDFLALLGQWGGPGACDLNGGGVGITDLLALLSQWGPCA